MPLSAALEECADAALPAGWAATLDAGVRDDAVARDDCCSLAGIEELESTEDRGAWDTESGIEAGECAGNDKDEAEEFDASGVDGGCTVDDELLIEDSVDAGSCGDEQPVNVVTMIMPTTATAEMLIKCRQ